MGATEPVADLAPPHLLVPGPDGASSDVARGLSLLPRRSRRRVGPWCFVEHHLLSSAPAGAGAAPDHAPADAAQPDAPAFHVPAHPHTGLQVLTWLFAGTLEHRTSAGPAALVQPGELSLLTAGRGASHSLSLPAGGETGTRAVRLAALLPPDRLDVAPALEHHPALPSLAEDGIRLTVLMGTLCGLTSPATTFGPLVCAQLDLAPGTQMALPTDAAFEHGVLVDHGTVTVDGVAAPTSHLVVVPPGRPYLRLTAGDAPVRLLLLGGPPHVDATLVWWGLGARDHAEVALARADWVAQRTRRARGADPAARFGRVADDAAPAAAPPLDGVRLRPSRRPG